MVAIIGWTLTYLCVLWKEELVDSAKLELDELLRRDLGITLDSLEDQTVAMVEEAIKNGSSLEVIQRHLERLVTERGTRPRQLETERLPDKERSTPPRSVPREREASAASPNADVDSGEDVKPARPAEAIERDSDHDPPSRQFEPQRQSSGLDRGGDHRESASPWMSSVSGGSFGRRVDEAWNDFRQTDYEAAIAHASECVKTSQSAADVLQQALEERGQPIPNLLVINESLRDPGLSEKEKSKLRDQYLARGYLNDVAVCFWIMGRSHEELGGISEAIDAYQYAAEYPYGLAWDPRGEFFWSPAREASNRARRLNETRK